jgi:hypothetical protein
MENLIIYIVLMKIRKISLQQIFLLSEVEIQSFIHSVQANIRYFLVWFQSLQLPWAESESSFAPLPLAPKSHESFKVCTQLLIEIFYFSCFDPD